MNLRILTAVPRLPAALAPAAALVPAACTTDAGGAASAADDVNGPCLGIGLGKAGTAAFGLRCGS